MSLFLMLTALSITLPFVNGQSVDEPRTFLGCYTPIAEFFVLSLTLTPSTVDPKDPQVKQVITNLCNFYHEKTGVWVNPFDSRDLKLIEPYSAEFNSTYYHTFPESLKEMFRILSSK